ncbi:phage tail protein [soil metagenome]
MTVAHTSAGSAQPVPVSRNRPRRDPNWLVNQLPGTMSSQDFFARFVAIFQELGSSLLENADDVEHVVDVSVAAPELVRWLGSWLGVGTLDPSMEEMLQRRIVGSAARNLTWRGTAHGLRSHLELITGTEVEIEEGGGIWRSGEAPTDTAWVRMWVKELGAAGAGARDLAEFIAVVRDEIPAHVRAELYVDGMLTWTTEEESST